MDQKQRLIDIYTAALEEFSEFGYSKATLTGIASRLGMTKGNLYFFIKSKENLYRDSIAWGLTRWQNRVFDEVGSIADVKQKFKTLCDSSYHYLAEDEVLRIILIKDKSLFPINPASGDTFYEIHDRSIKLIGTILEEGRVEGIFRTDFDTEHISQLVYSIYVMFIVKTYILEKRHSFEDYFNDGVDLILSGVLKK